MVAEDSTATMSQKSVSEKYTHNPSGCVENPSAPGVNILGHAVFPDTG
jgi:hypothetical protein